MLLGSIFRSRGSSVPALMSCAAECRGPFGMECLDAFAEVVRLAQAAVAMAFQLDRDRERGVFGVVEQLLGGALRDRGKGEQFGSERIGRRFQAGVRDAFGRDAPFIGL